MSMLYESWNDSQEDWAKSNLYLQCISKDSNKKKGVRRWMTFKELVERFGESPAQAITTRKLDDADLLRTETRWHPEAPNVEELAAKVRVPDMRGFRVTV